MTEKTELVHEALGKMDHADAEQWDKEGRPLLDVVRILADDDSISEADFDAAAKAYRRDANVSTGPTDDRPDMPEAATPIIEDASKTAKDKETDALDAQAEADKLTRRIEPLQKKISEIKTEVDGLQKERDKHLEKVAKHNPQRKLTEEIQRYQKQQILNAQNAASRNQKLAAALGVDAPQAAPSKLDAELRNKNRGHGAGRKAHPMLGGAKSGQDNKAGA